MDIIAPLKPAAIPDKTTLENPKSNEMLIESVITSPKPMVAGIVAHSAVACSIWILSASVMDPFLTREQAIRYAAVVRLG